MSGLSRADIIDAILDEDISIFPITAGSLQDASVDLRLGENYLELRDGETLDAHKDNSSAFDRRVISDYLILQPGDFLLGETVEHVSLGPRILAHLAGRSSVGRLGVLVHITAGVIDPGWNGKLTLEISNVTRGPVILYPGDRIAQLTFQYLLTPAKGYAGKYQGAEEPQVSRMFRDV